MVAGSEAGRSRVPIEKLVADGLVKSWQLKFPKSIVPWEEFSETGAISIGTRSVFLDVTSAPKEIKEFLTEFIQARMAGGETLGRFLEDHGKDPVDFFVQRVGPEKADARYLTVSQTTRVLIFLLGLGWKFNFNGNDK